MADARTILYEVEGPVATVVLNRPDRKNALVPIMIDRLAEVVATAAADDSVRVVVITGAGGAFCAGGDVKAMAEPAGGDGGSDTTAQSPLRTAAGFAEFHRRTTMAICRTIIEMGKPVVAAIPGAVAGAGFGLALCCDLRIAAESARFSTGYATVGLTGDWGTSFFLTQLAGPAAAKELLFLGDKLTAAHALGLGLLNRVVPDGELDGEVRALADRLAGTAPLALRAMKQNVHTALGGDFLRSLTEEAHHHATATFSRDHREAVKALAAGRPPSFTGT